MSECQDKGEECLSTKKAGLNHRCPEHGEGSPTSFVGLAVGAEESLAPNGSRASVVRGAAEEPVAEDEAETMTMDASFSADGLAESESQASPKPCDEQTSSRESTRMKRLADGRINADECLTFYDHNSAIPANFYDHRVEINK